MCGIYTFETHLISRISPPPTLAPHFEMVSRSAQSLHRDILSQDHSTNLRFFELRYVVANGPLASLILPLGFVIYKSHLSIGWNHQNIFLPDYTHWIAFITKNQATNRSKNLIIFGQSARVDGFSLGTKRSATQHLPPGTYGFQGAVDRCYYWQLRCRRHLKPRDEGDFEIHKNQHGH